MKKFPELLVRLFPSETLAKLKKLHSTYSGLHLRTGDKEFSIIEEVEHSVFAATVGSIEHDIDEVLYIALKESTFSNLDVYVKGVFWNPAKQTYKQFKIQNLDDGDPQVIHNEESIFCIKQHFLEMRV